MLNEFSADQPSVLGLLERMTDELGAKAVVLLHETGQLLHRAGWIDEAEYPSIAALVAGMIAAGKSLSSLGDTFPGVPSRFACDSDAMGLYVVGITHEVWLVVLYEQPLNPGQFRMRVRRYAAILAGLGVKKPEQWELPENVTSPAGARVTLPPVSRAGLSDREILTRNNSSLFGNITDDEIDELFENART